MSTTPKQPHIFHITHVDNLASIIAGEALVSDAQRTDKGVQVTDIGNSKIKNRRLGLDVKCHPGTKVGEYVPFYFCPRSIMLYLIHKGNHPDVCYRRGQDDIIHLEADLNKVVEWATSNNRKWAFSNGNAGTRYTQFFNALNNLSELNWDAISSNNFQESAVKEAKQAEFLFYSNFPWRLFDQIGVINKNVFDKVEKLLIGAQYKPKVVLKPEWYY